MSVAPGPSGEIGAWLVAGPLRAAKARKRAELSAGFELPGGILAGGAGIEAGAVVDKAAGRAFEVLASSDGSIDLGKHMRADGAEATAVAFVVLRAAAPWQGWLALSVDDGLSVLLDGKEVASREEARGAFPDDTLVPLELSAGDHPLLLRLHQRSGRWQLRARVVDRALAPPTGIRVVLPGEIDTTKLTRELCDLSLDRGLGPVGARPRFSARCLGFPDGVARTLDVRATEGPRALFAVGAGELPVPADGVVDELEVALPRLASSAPVTVTASLGPLSRAFEYEPHAPLVEALAAGARAEAAVRDGKATLSDAETTLATLEHLADRVKLYAGKGDPDARAQLDEAAWLGEFAGEILAGRDPVRSVQGARRLALRSKLDGRPSPFAIYVPRKLREGRSYPLVVGLHGLNGKPMNMLRWLFGRDDPRHDGEWEDRHPGDFPDVEGIFVAPMAHGNAMYRYAGEVDVMEVTRWVARTFPVDPARVSITGPSMGGTGTAAIALKYPDVFSSAAPLCGYHSWNLRGDFAARREPWERALGEHRSTVAWASNGLYLPMYIVHGTRDLPVENSGVLIDRYKALGYGLLEEHPDEGHNVWQGTYEGMKAFSWLAAHRRPDHPRRVVFRTDNLRYPGAHWLKIERLARSQQFADVSAEIKRGTPPRIVVGAKNVAALSFTREAKLLGDEPVEIELGRTKLRFDAGEALLVEQRDGAWQKGLTPPPARAKRGGLAGPMKDIFYDPVVVVYGTQDPRLARANEQVARDFARVRQGFDVAYPVLADREFDRALERTHALVLVGGPDSNSVTRALDARLPIHVRSAPPSVVVGDEVFTGDEVGAGFVWPNPDSPDRYVVVLAGATVEGTLRGMSLPDLLPDWVVWDAALARARGGMVLGRGAVRAGGQFDEGWALTPR
ncbi:MAG: prolyl oligopeptidase family serine peptidase [Polyangiaceae bacterium]|nr:prolyl oligopeptidase family serine peptidase [Polyangiaceae bacterium]